jgi:hypothetical protein
VSRIIFLIGSLFIVFTFLFHNRKYNAIATSNSTHELHERYEEAETDEPAKFFQFHAGIRTRSGESGPQDKMLSRENEAQVPEVNPMA